MKKILLFLFILGVTIKIVGANPGKRPMTVDDSF